MKAKIGIDRLTGRVGGVRTSSEGERSSLSAVRRSRSRTWFAIVSRTR